MIDIEANAVIFYGLKNPSEPLPNKLKDSFSDAIYKFLVQHEYPTLQHDISYKESLSGSDADSGEENDIQSVNGPQDKLQMVFSEEKG